MMCNRASIFGCLRLVALCLCFYAQAQSQTQESRPNIFIAISDDQSWLHASAYGSKMVKTPHFDRVASQGILFTNAFSSSPRCSPSRASLLTGRNTWQLEHAGTHASYFDPKYTTYPDRLAAAGYWVGYTGKGWGPGNFKKLGRKTKDPRVLGNGGVWETYPRVSALRWFPKPDWDCKNLDSIPIQTWVEKKRPRGK